MWQLSSSFLTQIFHCIDLSPPLISGLMIYRHIGYPLAYMQVGNNRLWQRRTDSSDSPELLFFLWYILQITWNISNLKENNITNRIKLMFICWNIAIYLWYIDFYKAIFAIITKIQYYRPCLVRPNEVDSIVCTIGSRPTICDSENVISWEHYL